MDEVGILSSRHEKTSFLREENDQDIKTIAVRATLFWACEPNLLSCYLQESPIRSAYVWVLCIGIFCPSSWRDGDILFIIHTYIHTYIHVSPSSMHLIKLERKAECHPLHTPFRSWSTASRRMKVGETQVYDVWNSWSKTSLSMNHVGLSISTVTPSVYPSTHYLARVRQISEGLQHLFHATTLSFPTQSFVLRETFVTCTKTQFSNHKFLKQTKVVWRRKSSGEKSVEHYRPTITCFWSVEI